MLPRCARRAGVYAIALLFFLTSERTAWGQQNVTFDFDDPPETDNRITDVLSYGAEIELDWLHTRNRDLDSGRNDEQTLFEPILDVAFTYQPNDLLRAYVDVELSRVEVIDSSSDGESDTTSLIFKEAYVTLREVFGGVTAQIGRQQFQDPLEWYYDQELDAMRTYYRIANVAFEASLSEQGLVDEDLLNKDHTADVTNAFLVGHYALHEQSRASGYLLYRDGRDQVSEDLLYFGVQSYGELMGDLDYWLNAAFVTGDARDEVRTRDVDGFGVDLIATYAPDLDWEPSLTLGFAFGSGDSNPDDGNDHGFRQTGLQENNANFNGVTRFKYYGEALDPELSNLAVLTLGAGIKPSEESSIDLVYHYYWQHHASGDLRSSNLTTDPDGRNRALGHGLDLVLGYLEIEDFSAKLVLGAFFPGRAFDSDADTAISLGFEMQYEF